MSEPAAHAPAAVDAYVGLGANLGDARATVLAAAEQLRNLPQTEWVALSALYASDPVDAAGPEFINAVAHVRTRLTPMQLLTALLLIETEHGRQRPFRNAPRTLDLDLLLYGDVTQTHPQLTLPHPRMHERRFVLEPLAELAPALLVPVHGALAPMLARVASQVVRRSDDGRADFAVLRKPCAP